MSDEEKGWGLSGDDAPRDIDSIPEAIPIEASQPEKPFVPAVPMEVPDQTFSLARILVMFAVMTVFIVVPTSVVKVAAMGNGGVLAARAQIEIHPKVTLTASASRLEDLWVHAPVDIETEIGWMKSDLVLERVIVELGLLKEFNIPAVPEAQDWLLDRVSVRSLSGNLVEVSVRLPENPNFALYIANTVCQAYGDSRNEVSQQYASMALSQLQLEMKAQEHMLEQARAVMFERLRESGGIDLAPWDSPEVETPLMRATRSGEISDEQRSALKKERRGLTDASFAKVEYIAARKLYDQMRTLLERASLSNKMPRKPLTFLSKARIRMAIGTQHSEPTPMLPALLGGLFAGMIFCLFLMIYWTLADRRRQT